MFALPYLLFRLAAIAVEMREAQRMYFIARTAGNLALAKKLETRLDKCLKLIQEHPDYATQTFTKALETEDLCHATNNSTAQPATAA